MQVQLLIQLFCKVDSVSTSSTYSHNLSGDDASVNTPKYINDYTFGGFNRMKLLLSGYHMEKKGI